MNCCLHILKKGFLPNNGEKHVGVRSRKLDPHLIYLYNMLLILYFFIDHWSTDDERAEEDAFKDESMHLLVYSIGDIIYG